MPKTPFILRIVLLVAALAMSHGSAWGDDADPQQLILREAYQSMDPPFLVLRVEARPDAPPIAVRWRTSRESYFVTHPDRPGALIQLSPLDGPLDLQRSADGVRIRHRVREWVGTPWQEASLATDYLILRPSVSEGTHFPAQVLVFAETAGDLDRFFSGARGAPALLPKFSLSEMSEGQKDALWQTVQAGDYALELLDDPRRVLHSFKFRTNEKETARLLVDVPVPTQGTVGARIRVETGDSVKTYEVDRISQDGNEFYTQTCGVIRGAKDYGALLQIQKDHTAKWHMDRFAEPILLEPDQPTMIVDSDGQTAVYALSTDALHTPIVKRPRRKSPPAQPAPAFIAYGNPQGLLYLQFQAERSVERDLMAPLNPTAWYFLGTRDHLMQVRMGGSVSEHRGWEQFEVEASFHMPDQENPGQELDAYWNPKQMNWEFNGRSALLNRLTPEEERALVNDVKLGKLTVSTISRNYRTPLALARTYGANPTYFYWDNAANGTIDYRFFVGTRGQMSLIDDDTIGEYHHMRDGGSLALETDGGLRVFLHTPAGAPLMRVDRWFNRPATEFKAGGSYLTLTPDGKLKPVAVQRSPTAKQLEKLSLTAQQLGILSTPPFPCAAILEAMDRP